MNRVILILSVASVAAGACAQDLDPMPDVKAWTRTLARWDFDKDAGGWQAVQDVELKAENGLLKLKMTGHDPHLRTRLSAPLPGPLGVKIRMRTDATGPGEVFWTTTGNDHYHPDVRRSFAVQADNQWHEYLIEVNVRQSVTGLRIDPGVAAGQAEIDYVEVSTLESYPVVFDRFRAADGAVEAVVRNRDDKPVELEDSGRTLTLQPGQTQTLKQVAPRKQPFESVPIVLAPKGLRPRTRTAVVYNPAVACDWATLKGEQVAVKVARDGSGAVIERGEKVSAVIAPLVGREGRILRLQLVKQTPTTIEFAGEGVRAVLAAGSDELAVVIHSSGEPIEGPVVRAVGALEQGLLAGLEYLGKGESSSSKLDIETPAHMRFQPNPLHVTMPLMVARTDRACVALSWTDMAVQPTYACPNFVDGAYGEHRMSLKARQVQSVVRVFDGTVEDAVAWTLGKMALPKLPERPRDSKAQMDLAMKALNGPLKNADGWGHCAESRWARGPHADIASIVWRITGQPPQLDKLVPGGSHVRNESIYFVTGRGQQWLERARAQARGIVASQQADGSFRYKGPYRKGHFEDTSSGQCGTHAARLLEYAYQTGDKEALAAGTKALDYIKRFRVPRGAQVWELSLHTPDILASAYLVWAYVRGYELTGREDYLKEARRWGLSGVPFVYLWGRYPVMPYATIAVYGATNFRAPLWIGLPVQWCGGVYAYALTLLARHDNSVDWRRLAEGIYVSAIQQTYAEGPHAGCLPDSWELAAQRPHPPDINPCAIISLQFALDGKPDGLQTAADAKHRVTGPYPVQIRDKQAYVDAPAGTKYQMIVDGKVVDVTSKGKDVIDLE
ncbi:MAG: hypothetical protein BWX88_01753 [Planctomycetes bacterium ADurb.Bin126]|nr:MAG: hypothetical protein BWX88_01753 [Planctomycetes bacterium ADurb.Bin126]HOD84199.1 hypothetical protein [Phycisphaerae bacterium]HQL74381.1 hypothetical protein [Phycisphaerae bacterium]